MLRNPDLSSAPITTPFTITIRHRKSPTVSKYVPRRMIENNQLKIFNIRMYPSKEYFQFPDLHVLGYDAIL
jgi:hypothetical protein